MPPIVAQDIPFVSVSRIVQLPVEEEKSSVKEKMPEGMSQLDFLFLKAKPKFKFIVLGMSSSGKTSIILNYLGDLNQEDKSPDVNVKFSEMKKLIKIKDPQTKREVEIELMIWDPAGADAYSSMTNQFFRDTHCMICVVDYT